MSWTISQLQKITDNNKHNILKMTSSCMWRHHLRQLYQRCLEITKVQIESNISQHLGKFACCCEDLLVLMTLSLFAWRHNLKKFSFKNLTKNSFNLQKIILPSLFNRFLDRGKFAPPPVQIGCKNSPVFKGLS